MAYMVAGYLIIWLCSFAFIVSMVQRERGLRRDIETLKELAGEQKPREQRAEVETVTPAPVRQ